MPKFVQVSSVLSLNLSSEEFLGGRVPYTLHWRAFLCNSFHYPQPDVHAFTGSGPVFMLISLHHSGGVNSNLTVLGGFWLPPCGCFLALTGHLACCSAATQASGQRTSSPQFVDKPSLNANVMQLARFWLSLPAGPSFQTPSFTRHSSPSPGCSCSSDCSAAALA